MFSLFRKTPKKPPSRSQIELCARLGIEITPKMGQEDISKLLSESLQKEKYKKIYDEIQRERDEQFEKEEREEYGDEIVDELKKWEKYCDVYKQYYLIFKRGGKVQSDIAELESAEIMGEKKYYIQLGILLPKLHKDKDTGDYLEWEKEVTLKPEQILKIEELKEPIDMFDLGAYETAKKKCESMATEYMA
jgi:hypothetical protein